MVWLSPTSYIVFLFVNTENNNFIKEIKHVRTSIACWKPRQSLWEFTSRSHWSALEFSQTFASVFTRLWRHGKHVLFLKWNWAMINFSHIVVCQLFYTYCITLLFGCLGPARIEGYRKLYTDFATTLYWVRVLHCA